MFAVNQANVEISRPRDPLCSLLTKYPGPLGRASDLMTKSLIEFLSDLNPRTELVMYLILLLRRLDPRKSLFLLGFEMEFNSAKPVSHFFATLAMCDIVGATEIASQEPSLWPHLLAFCSAVQIDEEKSKFVRQTFAEIFRSCNRINDDDPEIKSLQKFLAASATDSKSSPAVDTAFWRYQATLFGAYSLLPFASNYLVKLGSALLAEGDAEAGHVCFLLSGQVEIMPVDHGSSLMSVLSVDHRNQKALVRVLDPRSIIFTEIFEYVERATDKGKDVIVGLQPFKLVLAMEIAAQGEIDKAKRYLQFINAFCKAIPASKLSSRFKTILKEFEMRCA